MRHFRLLKVSDFSFDFLARRIMTTRQVDSNLSVFKPADFLDGLQEVP
jgi:hypothetical protein